LVGKPEGRRTRGRHRGGWEDNIKMYLKEIGCEGGNYILLTQDKDQWRIIVNIVMKLSVP
jgi:hypothetical protein